MLGAARLGVNRRERPCVRRERPSSALFPGPQRCAISALRQQSLGKVETFVKLRDLS
jgi:hypothetical protein